MSLWTIPVDKITFKDVDEFLLSQKTENDRLDYKAAIPGSLDKSIAAFANTNGGLIIVGVEENTKTNLPVWPPKNTGILQDDASGLRDSITQIANDSIYPPVTSIQVSNVLTNAYVPSNDRVIVVIRVDMSKEAPHAIDHKRSIFVIERIHATTSRFSLADIDRIAALLKRRSELAEQRERTIKEEIEKGASQITIKELPLVWASIIPAYPWRDLYAKQKQDFLLRQHDGLPLLTMSRCTARPQGMPQGSYALGQSYETRPAITHCSRLSNNGHVFCIQSDMYNFEEGNAGKYIQTDQAIYMLAQVMNSAMTLYGSAQVEKPGELLFSLGFINIQNVRAYSGRGQSSHNYLDPTYRFDQFANYATLVAAPWAIAKRAWENFIYCFNIRTQMSLSEFKLYYQLHDPLPPVDYSLPI